MGEMLKDGSNPEGVDPVPPVEWKSAADFKGVVLYGVTGSPPCAKLRAYLIKYGIDFKMVNGTGKKGSDYKKMPVLDVNGRQVNDTYIILKNMAPVLTGKAIDDEWEIICSYQLGPSIECSLSKADAVKWMADPHGFGPPKCLLSCCLANIILNKAIKPNVDKAVKAMPDKYKVAPLNEFGEKLKAAIGESKFHGGDEPGQVDISFYGVCSPFYFSKCDNVTGMISSCGLQDWWDRMEKEIPLSKLFP
eukprot:gnl/TRDRNA2_/TRDRNA2_190366_c0_seq1.p1 gnl/TRDRNA2_/TRDRNA2_190366_c0~~gnl/TRDRNA2_/TRDRNA2_190366_c0_seq1.p1  ORF type:complete len:248 (-),score=68.58 gnl/TRDRNA2_/TRDRNA2_190366_c0_seq1:310-1053(-)